MDQKRLSLGPIGEAQEVLGKPHQEWDKTEQLLALAIAFGHNQERAQHYDAMCDTHYNAPFSLSQHILREFGFKQIWTAQGMDRRSLDHLEVWLYDNSILCTLESYSITGNLNSGQVFACVPWASVKGLPIGSYYSCKETDACMMDWDAREGLRYLLERLVPRPKHPFPWPRHPYGFTLILPGEMPVGNASDAHMRQYRLLCDNAAATRLPEVCKAAGVNRFWRDV